MNKKRLIWAILLWIAFMFLIGLICFISFQDGVDSARVDVYIKQFAQYYFNTTEIPDEVMVHFVWKFRQLVRICIFALLAVVGTSTIHISFHKLSWISRTFIAAIILMGLAVGTEKFKMYLPTRHFSQQEMLFSILGVLAGFAFATLITFTYSVVKWGTGKLFESARKNKRKNEKNKYPG